MISPDGFGYIVVAALGALALTSWALRRLERRHKSADRRLIRAHIQAKGLRLRRVRLMYRAFPLLSREYELILSRAGPETRWDYLEVRGDGLREIAEGEWQKSRRRLSPPRSRATPSAAPGSPPPAPAAGRP